MDKTDAAVQDMRIVLEQLQGDRIVLDKNIEQMNSTITEIRNGFECLTTTVEHQSAMIKVNDNQMSTVISAIKDEATQRHEHFDQLTGLFREFTATAAKHMKEHSEQSSLTHSNNGPVAPSPDDTQLKAAIEALADHINEVNDSHWTNSNAVNQRIDSVHETVERDSEERVRAVWAAIDRLDETVDEYRSAVSCGKSK
jgi:chromosome segregation ATPase